MKALSLSALALAAISSGSNAQDAVVPTDFPTIAAAVALAQDVDLDGTVHISVLPGTYAGSLFIQRSNLRLEGAGAANTFIQGTTGLRAVRIESASNIEFSGFSVTGDPQRDGVSVTGVNSIAIHDNVVTGTQDGIRINRTNNAVITANVVDDNTSSGIKIKGGDANLVAGNSCNGNRSTGVDLDNTANCQVTANVCTANLSNGVRVRRATMITVEDNTCTGNRDNGMRVEQVLASTFAGNVCTGNLNNGLRIRDVATCTFDLNVLTGNVEWGIRMRDSLNNDWDAAQAGSQAAPGSNDVSGNGLGAIRVD